MTTSLIPRLGMLCLGTMCLLAALSGCGAGVGVLGSAVAAPLGSSPGQSTASQPALTAVTAGNSQPLPCLHCAP